jgi:hypothetical protein
MSLLYGPLDAANAMAVLRFTPTIALWRDLSSSQG